MTWIIIISILLFIFGWLLLAPLYLYVSTPESRYEAGLTGVFKVRIVTDERGLPQVVANLLFFSFRVPLFQFRTKEKKGLKTKAKKKKARRMTRKRIRLIMRIIWKIIRSFRLKQLKLNIDTGDVIRNAYLIPVFSFAYRENIRLSVNYESRNEFILHFENTIGRIILQTLQVYINHHLKK